MPLRNLLMGRVSKYLLKALIYKYKGGNCAQIRSEINFKVMRTLSNSHSDQEKKSFAIMSGLQWNKNCFFKKAE